KNNLIVFIDKIFNLIVFVFSIDSAVKLLRFFYFTPEDFKTVPHFTFHHRQNGIFKRKIKPTYRTIPLCFFQSFFVGCSKVNTFSVTVIYKILDFIKRQAFSEYVYKSQAVHACVHLNNAPLSTIQSLTSRQSS